MTAAQLARRGGVTRVSCSDGIQSLAARGLVRCLNPEARSSRLYWLTDAGMRRQRAWSPAYGRPKRKVLPESIDWNLYGWVCYRHRAAIIKALTEPLQPAAIKRRARTHNPGIRMSANNVRDVIRLFVSKGIVRRITAKRSHPRYELSEVGQQLRHLLLEAETLESHVRPGDALGRAG